MEKSVECETQTLHFFQQDQCGRLFPPWSEEFQGVSVPLITADAAYQLQTPCPEGQGQAEDQRRFNYKLSRARMCVEGAFGRLKTR